MNLPSRDAIFSSTVNRNPDNATGNRNPDNATGQTEQTGTRTGLTEVDLDETITFRTPGASKAYERAMKQKRSVERKALFKRHIDYVELYPKVWEDILKTLDEACLDAVMSDSKYTTLVRDKDPLLLLQLIRRKFSSAYGTEQLKSVDVALAKKEYANFSQDPNEDLSVYKQRYKRMLEKMVAIGIDLGTEQEQAAVFFNSLDPIQFGQFRSSLLNDVNRKAAKFPKTIDDVGMLAFMHEDTSARVPRLSPVVMATTTTSSNSNSVKYSKKKPYRKPSNSGTAPSSVSNPSSSTSSNAASTSSRDDNETDWCDFHKMYGHSTANCRARASSEGGAKKKAHVTYTNFMTRSEGVEDNVVILDPAAEESIFSNPNLLTNIRPSARVLEFSGVIRESVVVVDQCGEFGVFGTVFFSPQCAGNLLSWGAVHDSFPKKQQPILQVDNREQQFKVHIAGEIHVFKREGKERLFTKEFSGPLSRPDWMPKVFVTSADIKRAYTPGEVKAAEQVKAAMDIIGAPSTGMIIEAAQSGAWKNVPFSARDVENCTAIFGEHMPNVKGKTTKQPDVRINRRTERIERVISTSLDLYADIMTVAHSMYLLCVLKPIGLISTVHLGNERGAKSSESLLSALRSVVVEVRSENFDVRTVFFDGESGIKSRVSGESLKLMGLHPEITDGIHVGEAERAIRTHKEWTRGIATTRDWTMPLKFYPHLVSFVTLRLNLFPSKRGYIDIPAVEAFRGIKVDYHKDLRVGFGTYCQITRKFGVGWNSVELPRTEGAISLHPAMDAAGSVNFWVLRSGAVVKRHQFKAFPTPMEVVTRITVMAAEEGVGLIDDIMDDEGASSSPAQGSVRPTFRSDEAIRVIQQRAEVPDDRQHDVADPVPSVNNLADINDVADTNDVAEAGEHVGGGGDDVEPSDTPHNDEEASLQGSDDGDEGELASHASVSSGDAGDAGHDGGGPARNLRRKARVDYSDMFGNFMVETTDHIAITKAFRISVAKALEEMPAQASEAINQELQQMLDHDVFDPVKTTPPGVRPLRTTMFLKKKVQPNGEFIKWKARYVGGGDQQTHEEYSRNEISSPTASITSLLIVASMAASEGRSVATADFSSAYLKAVMPEEHKVFVRVDPRMAAFLLKLRPQLREFVRGDGSLVMRLKRALYGCIQSARLWYDTIKNTLESMGFVANPRDNCVFRNDTTDVIVVLYVDDLFITANSDADIANVTDSLNSIFTNGLTVHTGQRHSFLGMDFDFSSRGRVDVKMTGFIDDVLAVSGTTAKCKTPALENLFVISGEDPELPTNEAETFHSTVMKLLYLAKRVRPDILLAVSFLTTRNLHPHQEDQVKLRRVLGYLNQTRQVGITLGGGETGVRLRAFIDAAYGVHSDGKSQSGCVVTLGGSTVFAKCSKQRINTKSSHEAELVSLSDNASVVIWAADFLIHLKKYPHTPVILQDNLSTIASIESGSPRGELSQHINLKYFWLHDRIQMEDVRVEYIESERMLADVLTKPLAGAKFAGLRDQLLGMRR